VGHFLRHSVYAAHPIDSLASYFSINTITGLSLIKFCTNMQFADRKSSTGFQGHRPKVKVTGLDFGILHHCDRGFAATGCC